MTTLILQQKRDGFSLSHTLVSLFSQLQLWMDKYHQRQQLKKLDNHQLDDLGLDRELVSMEVAKPFWK